jgi:hypothetical protein
MHAVLTPGKVKIGRMRFEASPKKNIPETPCQPVRVGSSNIGLSF